MDFRDADNVMTKDSSAWQVIRVVYFDDDNIDLILGPVADVVKYLRDQSLSVMVLPYWKFGPHVDIVTYVTKKAFDEELFPVSKNIIDDWLRQHPSQKILDSEKYAELSIKIAATELELPPFLPLYENNQVLKADYILPVSIKSESLAHSKEDFMCASVELVLELAKLKKNHLSDLYIVLIKMIALIANKYEIDGISRGFITFRSHAEYFFLSYDPQGTLRNNFDLLYKKYKLEIDDGIAHVINADYEHLFADVKYGGLLRSWNNILNLTYKKNAELVEEEIDFFKSEDVHAGVAQQVFDATPQKYHQEMKTTEIMGIMANTEEGQRIFKSREFLTYRIIVNNFYKLLPILGFSPVQKYCLCHLVATSVEYQLNLSWEDIMKGENRE